MINSLIERMRSSVFWALWSDIHPYGPLDSKCAKKWAEMVNFWSLRQPFCPFDRDYLESRSSKRIIANGAFWKCHIRSDFPRGVSNRSKYVGFLTYLQWRPKAIIKIIATRPWTLTTQDTFTVYNAISTFHAFSFLELTSHNGAQTVSNL